MSFAALKKQSKSAIENLSKRVDQEKSGGYAKDDRFWKLDVDKSGNGSAVIRFMPAPEGEEFPYVKRFEYFIKQGNRYYIENCRSTLGEPDPMNEHFFEVRGEDPTEAQKTAARKYSRSTNYIANVYIVSDAKHPENEGKVFLFKFGSRIFQKLEGAINPEFDDENPFNPFCLWEGANFKLKARQLDGQRSYDKSGFDAIEPLDEDDKVLEKLWAKCHSLADEVAPDKFKSYEELQKKMELFLNGKEGKSGKSSDDGDANDKLFPKRGEDDDEAPRRKSAGASRRKPAKSDDDDDEPAPRRKPAKSEDEDDEPAPRAKAAKSEDEDDLAQYRSMLGDD